MACSHRGGRKRIQEVKRVYRVHPELRKMGDPFTGVVSERGYLHSGGTNGRKFAPPKPWQWNPPEVGRNGKLGPQPDPEVHVRGDGWTSAHGGTVGDVRESDEERYMRGAQLNREELEVLRLHAMGKVVDGERVDWEHAEIGEQLGLTARQVRTRIQSGNRKVTEYKQGLAQLSPPAPPGPRPPVRAEQGPSPPLPEHDDNAPPAQAFASCPRQGATLML